MPRYLTESISMKVLPVTVSGGLSICFILCVKSISASLESLSGELYELDHSYIPPSLVNMLANMSCVLVKFLGYC